MLAHGELEHWNKGLRDAWLLPDDAIMEQLDGEYDLNFRVGTEAVLKVMRADCDTAFIEMQVAALQHCSGLAHLPKVVPARDGSVVVEMAGLAAASQKVWALSLLPGRPFAKCRPQSFDLIRNIGSALGAMDRRLESFEHPQLDRALKWNLTTPLWAKAHFDLVEDKSYRATLERVLARFEQTCAEVLTRLPAQAIHNDLNDYNILCQTHADGTQSVSGLIDFGDMIRAPAVCDLAIAGAYVVLDQVNPIEALASLVAGYCEERPLDDQEIEVLWPLLLTRLAVSALNAAHMERKKPDDPYVMISQAPISRFFERLPEFDPHYVTGCLRAAAGHDAVPAARLVLQDLVRRADQLMPVFKEDLSCAKTLDLSVAGADAPQDPVSLDAAELTRLIYDRVDGDRPTLGRYGEPRLIYTASGFSTGIHPACDRRTIHIGIDVFLPAGTPVHAPLNGTVHSVALCPEDLGYGGVVVLQHMTESGVPYYSLYGHMAHDVVQRHSVGDQVAAGDVIALLGGEHENGGWPPHLHLQLGVIDLPGPEWLGVAYPDAWPVWRQLCPDPAPLLGLPVGHAEAPVLDVDAVRSRRNLQTSANLRLSYREPISVLRGWKSYLFDDRGRPYLDAYNNVPHVGHAHPRITQAVMQQMRMVNTNTRYLQPVHEAYCEALSARLPDGLDVCFLLSSASEANDVALRLARAATGGRDTIVSQVGYHGHTCATIEISDYKFSGPGGEGKPEWVHVAENPDTYRGAWAADDSDAGANYAVSVETCVHVIGRRGGKLACFISEPFPSVAGQLVPPPGYLEAVYAHVRGAGGICIADEVQTGLGRLGCHEWGFEQQGVVPDIVVLGKPIGNGYPLAAVVTTRAIAEAFANGMEFFSTFGGSTVSCVAGHEVLRVLDDEKLADNAASVGDHLMDGLRALSQEVDAVGDVRGLGLFIGVEMVKPDGAPSQRKADYVVNRLRERRILIGSDGPHDNVLKIRPPLCFSHDDADYLLTAMNDIIRDDMILDT